MKKNNGDEMFDGGTPWDYIQDMARLVDNLVNSHNKLVNDHEALKKKHDLLVSAHKKIVKDLQDGKYTQ